MNNHESCEPCGCDAGANYLCFMHSEARSLAARVVAGKQHTTPVPAFISDAVDQSLGVGIGGAPTRVTTLPNTAAARKMFPIASGFLDYFPDAVAAISNLSYVGNEQHNPGKPLHWDRSKSADEADTMMRHFMARGTKDTDGIRHTVKAAWRMLALLQKELEQEGK